MKKIFLIILLIFISGCIQSYNPYQKEFAGIKLNFRANLEEAKNIPVYPNETALRNIILNEDVEEISIAYIPQGNESMENAFYAADSFELAYKLTVINKYYFNKTKPINSVPVNSTQEALALSSYSKPVIMLIGPPHTNLTMVYVNDSLIEVHGKSFEEVNRTFTDLDLATDKLLLVLMETQSFYKINIPSR